MSGRRVLVIEHQEDAGIGLLGERLRAAGVELEVVGPDTGRDIPGTLAGFDGLIVLGGSMGPTEDDRAPWLPVARARLGEALAQGVPTLGVCLGAQLLATAAGGRVALMPDGPEIGVSRIAIAESAAEDRLFAEFAGAEFPAVQWHWLEAQQLPEGAEVLAANAACRNQAFRIGACAWGVQFHPEALAATFQAWAEHEPEDLASAGLEAAALTASVRDAEPGLRRAWGTLADRFAELLDGERSGRSPAAAS